MSCFTNFKVWMIYRDYNIGGFMKFSFKKKKKNSQKMFFLQKLGFN